MRGHRIRNRGPNPPRATTHGASPGTSEATTEDIQTSPLCMNLANTQTRLAGNFYAANNSPVNSGFSAATLPKRE
jgi:hypothetical protein